MGKSMGSVAASWKPTILASGFNFSLSASPDEVNKTAAAPSFNVDALAAVTVPFSFCNITGMFPHSLQHIREYFKVCMEILRLAYASLYQRHEVNNL